MESNDGRDFVWGGWLKPYQYILGESTEVTEARKMGKKQLEKATNDAFRKYFDRVQVSLMKLGAIYKDIEAAIVSGADLDKVMPELRKKYGIAEAYAPLDTKGLVGAFTEATKKKRFEYRASTNSWGKSHGLPHEVCVSYRGGSSKDEWRAANVKGTVCYIAVDEGADGKPVMEKWAIRNHVKYVKAESVEVTEATTPATPTHGYKVGDILFGSTSYGMTIPHFYRVVGIVGVSKIQVVELELQRSGDGWQGQATPSGTPKSAPRMFTVRRKAGGDPGIKVSNYLVAQRWDGRPAMYDYLD